MLQNHFISFFQLRPLAHISRTNAIAIPVDIFAYLLLFVKEESTVSFQSSINFWRFKNSTAKLTILHDQNGPNF